MNREICFVKNETEKNFTNCAVRYVVQYCVIEGDPNIPDREMIRIEGNPGCFPAKTHHGVLLNR